MNRLSKKYLMNEPAIQLDGLSKCFQIYEKPHHRLLQLLSRGRRKYFQEFWALKDISLKVDKGETVGIIGKNGAGKSTLLQIICGTLTPTSGVTKVKGRVAALLELGAGFNPEFTGRENVLLSASIIGLSKEEIEAKYDDIAAFADIGDFINQPVKRYSSGMFVRLAFAVAISVEPNILVVDEALSVGDINFRNKCMNRIKALQDSGIALLFVSHDLGAIQTICDRAIWISGGVIQEEGLAVSVCQNYHASITKNKNQKENKNQSEGRAIPQQESDMARFTNISVESKNMQNQISVFKDDEKIAFFFELQTNKPLGQIVFAVSIYRDDGDWLIGQTSREKGVIWDGRSNRLRGKLELEPNILAPGNYQAAFGAYSEDLTICYALTDLSIPFHVRLKHPIWGKVIAPCRWVTIYE